MSEQYDNSANALLLAAQKQVEALQSEVRDGRKQARWTKIQVRILGAVCAIMLAVVGILGAVLGQEASFQSQLHSEVVSSCQTGNQQRAQEIKVWDTFIDLILRGNTSKQAIAEGQEFKSYIAQVYAPRNCQAQYNVTADPDSGISP